jgi:hypothetical protein
MRAVVAQVLNWSGFTTWRLCYHRGGKYCSTANIVPANISALNLVLSGTVCLKLKLDVPS